MKDLWLRIAPLCISFVLYAVAVCPAEKPKPVDIQEEIEVSLVNVFLTATDSKGNFVTDLRADELTLKEDGKPQTITGFDLTSQGSEPLTVAILIDTSVSMNETHSNLSKLDMAKEGALRILSHLQMRDRMLLLTFSNKPLEATTLTSDKELVTRKISELKTDYGRTALLDALFYAAEKLNDEPGRKIFFVCSDGQDNASTKTLEKVLKTLKVPFDIMIMTLATSGFKSKYNIMGLEAEIRAGQQTLQSLAETTAGYSFIPKNLKDLDNVMDKLRLVVPSQYFLSYSPSTTTNDGLWKSIEIRCKRRGVKLHHRSGYFAEGSVSNSQAE